MTVNRTSDKAQNGRPTSGPTRGGSSYGLEDVVSLLPTPAVNDMGASYTPETWDAWTAKMQAAHGNGNGHGKSLAIEAQRLTVPDESPAESGDQFVINGFVGSVLPLVDLDEGGEVADGFGAEVDVHTSNLAPDSAAHLTSSGSQFGNCSRLLPTPASRDYKDHRIEVAAHRPGDADNLNRAIAHLLPTPNTMDGMTARSDEALTRARMSGGCSNLKDVRPQEWGDYAPAIARWEHVIGRPAPAPTEPGKTGNPRLSPAFVEWLMGLPAGHVTGVDISRNDQLKALGNGVVPQQAAAATQAFIHDISKETAA